jgi:hypothetical protein
VEVGLPMPTRLPYEVHSMGEKLWMGRDFFRFTILPTIQTGSCNT